MLREAGYNLRKAKWGRYRRELDQICRDTLESGDAEGKAVELVQKIRAAADRSVLKGFSKWWNHEVATLQKVLRRKRKKYQKERRENMKADLKMGYHYAFVKYRRGVERPEMRTLRGL